jgi:hypothetical protein
MDILPGGAEFGCVPIERGYDALDLSRGEAVIATQTDWTGWAVQIKGGVTLGCDDVNVRRPMVVRVDDYAQVPNSQGGRHRRRIA